MGDATGIEWTDATWNPVVGCTILSPGCANCYAMREARRLGANPKTPQYAGLTRIKANGAPVWNGKIRLVEHMLDRPTRWRRPRRIFVNSMSDLFHRDIPRTFIRRCFRVMLEVNRHIYQILTKRPARAARFVTENTDLLPDGIPGHIWMGTSVEGQSVDYRIRHLVDVPARVRFLSCEPLIARLSLATFLIGRADLHWVIVGGESGPRARPVNPDWVRLLRDQCVIADVPFFFKQWGGITPKAGGRELDGEKWEQFPPPESGVAG